MIVTRPLIWLQRRFVMSDEDEENLDWSPSSSGSSGSSGSGSDREAHSDRFKRRFTPEDDDALKALSTAPQPLASECASTPPARSRRSRRVSKLTIESMYSSTAAAYTEALRFAGNTRESISMASPIATRTHDTSTPVSKLPEETRQRHVASKRRMELASATQQQIWKAHELHGLCDELPLWLHACVIPPVWRQKIQTHIERIHDQLKYCETQVLDAWSLLLPPFETANVAAFEHHLALYVKATALLEAALLESQDMALEGERTAACRFLQGWVRTQLTKRGFYTRSVKLSQRHRGLIPGLFDSIAGRSKLTINRKTQETTLEYPISSFEPTYADASPSASKT